MGRWLLAPTHWYSRKWTEVSRCLLLNSGIHCTCTGVWYTVIWEISQIMVHCICTVVCKCAILSLCYISLPVSISYWMYCDCAFLITLLYIDFNIILSLLFYTFVSFFLQFQTDSLSFYRVVKQLRSTAFISAVLHAMSALVCCGPIFDHQALIIGRYIYRWLENMLCSSEEKVRKRKRMRKGD